MYVHKLFDGISLFASVLDSMMDILRRRSLDGKIITFSRVITVLFDQYVSKIYIRRSVQNNSLKGKIKEKKSTFMTKS